jgi:hypothetical protein
VKKTPDDGQRNCSRHVGVHSKNKFEKLVHVVGFIVNNILLSLAGGNKWPANCLIAKEHLLILVFFGG